MGTLPDAGALAVGEATSRTARDSRDRRTPGAVFGTVHLQLLLPPKLQGAGFRTRGMDLTTVAKFDVQVTAADLLNPLQPSPNPLSLGSTTVTLTVPAGKNRVFRVRGLDSSGAELPGITVGALTDVLGGTTQTIPIGQHTTPAALVAQTLLDRRRGDLLGNLSAQGLQDFVNRITGPSNNFTAFQFPPALVDIGAVAAVIVASGAVPTDPTSASFRQAGGTVQGQIKGLVNRDRVQVTVSDPASLPATTDAQGNYRIDRVAAGTWTLQAATDYYERPASFPTVTVASGQTVSQDLNLVSASYFDRLSSTDTAINPTGGVIVRWSKMPIQVYLVVPDDPTVEFSEVHRQAVLSAIETWNSLAADVLSVRETKDHTRADILVYWTRSLGGTTIGYATYLSNTGRDLLANVQLATYRGDGQKASEPLLKQSALHELGHALGLWAHSDRETDLLFPQTDERINLNVSRRDLNTLRRLYRTPPDVTRS